MSRSKFSFISCLFIFFCKNRAIHLYSNPKFSRRFQLTLYFSLNSFTSFTIPRRRRASSRFCMRSCNSSLGILTPTSKASYGDILFFISGTLPRASIISRARMMRRLSSFCTAAARRGSFFFSISNNSSADLLRNMLRNFLLGGTSGKSTSYTTASI